MWVGTVTAVVPTRNEAGNVTELVKRLPDEVANVIFVDDSDDDTPAQILGIGVYSGPQVDLIHRPAGERTGGLAGAVCTGFAQATGEWWCVLDGDLQHPPEVISSLRERAGQGDVDIVVACRVGDEAWAAMSRIRRTLSSLAGRAAHLAFRRRLRTADPMSGFFLVRGAAIDVQRLRADGFKILLEILITHPELRVAEVPYIFGRREHGHSKGTVREGLRYGRHLAGLYVRAGRATAAERSRRQADAGLGNTGH